MICRVTSAWLGIRQEDLLLGEVLVLVDKDANAFRECGEVREVAHEVLELVADQGIEAQGRHYVVVRYQPLI